MALSKKKLTVAYRDKLQSSGITTTIARRLKFEIIEADEMAKLGFKRASGFKIPYFTQTGKQTKFYRVRYLEDSRTPLEKKASAKQVRYSQPKSTLNEVYLPPLVDWSSILMDSQQTIIITEGELKSAASTLHVLPTVGLGGVWNWKSKKELLPRLPFFDSVNWSNREVLVVFDADAANNPRVQQAQNALCSELMRLGAVPMVINVPELEEIEKAGLDDFISVYGGEEVKDYLLQNADSFDTIKPLKELNGEVLYVRDPGFILRVENHQKINCKSFTEHAFSDRQFTEELIVGDNVKEVIKSAPKEWLKWPGRAVVEKLVYEPGKESFLENTFNVWPGWAVEPKKGNIKPWNELLDYLFTGAEKKDRLWLEKWLAYPLQVPGTKLFTNALIWSVGQGVGKSLVAYSMFRIYGDNSVEIGDDEIESGSNDWAENKQFILADDILHEGGRKKSLAENLRRMTTREKLWINIKYVPRYSTRDCINYYLTSNHPDAVFLEDRDRRTFVHEVTTLEPLPQDFYDNYGEWLDGEGPAALFYHLLHIDLKDFNPRAPAPVTSAKKEMIYSGKSELATWVAQLKQAPDTILTKSRKLAGISFLDSADLLFVYDPSGKSRVTANTMARELKKAGFIRAAKGAQVWAGEKNRRLWIVRNVNLYKTIDSPTKIARIYEQEVVAANKLKFKKQE